MVIVDNNGVMMEWYLPSNSGPLRSDGVIIHTEVSWWVDGSCGESRDCTTLMPSVYMHACTTITPFKHDLDIGAKMC